MIPVFITCIVHLDMVWLVVVHQPLPKPKNASTGDLGELDHNSVDYQWTLSALTKHAFDPAGCRQVGKVGRYLETSYPLADTNLWFWY